MELTVSEGVREMKHSFLMQGAVAAVGVALVCAPVGAQTNKLPPGAVADKIVKTGYGLDKDQPFAGADPDGTGLPVKEPPPAAVAAAKDAPTPKMADGHIDLTGFWGPAGWGYAVTQGKVTADGKTAFTQRQEEGPVQTREKAEQLKKRMEGANLPPYRPELVAKVKDLADHQSMMDPAFTCAPKGFPRVGPPTEIVATTKTIAFLYDTVNSSEQNAFRVIPMDGRGHDITLNPSYYGDSIGHWEGNTLVVDVTNFVDDTWLSQNGTIHSDAMHVIEKLTREGNVITWEISIDDPKVFTRPWVYSRHLIHGLASGHALEEAPCVEHDRTHLVNTDRN
jgi:hypothetical protein